MSESAYSLAISLVPAKDRADFLEKIAPSIIETAVWYLNGCAIFAGVLLVDLTSCDTSPLDEHEMEGLELADLKTLAVLYEALSPENIEEAARNEAGGEEARKEDAEEYEDDFQFNMRWAASARLAVEKAREYLLAGRRVYTDHSALRTEHYYTRVLVELYIGDDPDSMWKSCQVGVPRGHRGMED